MRERLGSYVLASPLDDESGVQTRNATSLGQGGRAERVRLDVLHVGDAIREPLKRRFSEDAEAARTLTHDALVPLLGHGIDAGFAYIAYAPYVYLTVAEIFEGSDDGRLAPELAAMLGADIASGLAAAHELRPPLVHGGVDLRSVRVDSSGRARLHGHALTGLEQGLTRARKQAWQNPHYLSPEIVQGAQITERTDLFSLGSTLYEVLCGRRAFRGSSPADATMKLRSGAYESLDAVAPELPAELRGLVAELLSKDPGRRPLPSAVHETLNGLAKDASAQRKRVAAIVRPPTRTPRIPTVQTKPAVLTPEHDVAPPDLRFGSTEVSGAETTDISGAEGGDASKPERTETRRRSHLEDTVARPTSLEATVAQPTDLGQIHHAGGSDDTEERPSLPGAPDPPTALLDMGEHDANPFFEAEPTMLDRSVDAPNAANAPIGTVPLLDGPTMADPRSLASAFGEPTEALAPPMPNADPPTHLTIALPVGPEAGGSGSAANESGAAPTKSKWRLALTVAGAAAAALAIITLGVFLTLWIAS